MTKTTRSIVGIHATWDRSAVHQCPSAHTRAHVFACESAIQPVGASAAHFASYRHV